MFQKLESYTYKNIKTASAFWLEFVLITEPRINLLFMPKQIVSKIEADFCAGAQSGFC